MGAMGNAVGSDSSGWRRGALAWLACHVAMACAVLATPAWPQSEGAGQVEEAGNPSEAAQGRAAAQAAHWTAGLSVEPLWESNANFAPNPAAADVGTRLRLDLDRTLRWPRIDLRLNGNASGLFYNREVGLNHMAYAVNGSLEYRLSPGASLRLTQAIDNDYAREIAALTDSGLLFERVLARTYFTTATLKQRLSRLTTASVSLRLDAYTFSSGLAALANGSTFAGRVDLSRTLSRDDTLWIAYEAKLERSTLERGTSQTALLGWTRKLGSHVELMLSGGAGLSRPLAESSWVAAALGSGSLHVQLARQRISVTFNRDIGQAYGLGLTRVSNGVTLSDELRLSRRVQITMSAGHTHSLPVEVGELPFDAQTVYASMRWTHSQHVSSTAGYRLYRLSTGASTLMDHQATVGLALTGSWR